jgi:hypothetical protein
MSQNLKTGYSIGTINEGGWLENFSRKGFDAQSSWDEMTANSLDAGAKQIQLDRDSDTIYMSDDGRGMDKDTATVMFNMYEKMDRKNTIGMANAGLKYALYILGNQQKTSVITLNQGQYLTLVADWAKMLKEARYSSNILMRESNPEEIETFQRLMPRTSGTTICMQYSQQSWTAIEEQINHDSEGGYINIPKSLAFRYGRYPRDVSICLFDKGQRFQMKMYNPSTNILFEKVVRNIHVFADEQRYKFVSDKNETFRKLGKGVAKEASVLTRTEMEQLGNSIGSLEVTCYIPNDPKYLTSYLNAKGWTPPALQEIFTQHSPKELQLASMHPGVFRAGYRLGSMDLNSSTENIRSNYKARLYYDIHTDVVIQESENDCLDTIMGTQENKGQYVDTSPTEVKRLIDMFKRDYREFVLDKVKPKDDPKHVKVEPVVDSTVDTKVEPTVDTKVEPSDVPIVVPVKLKPPDKKPIDVPGFVKGKVPDTEYDMALEYLFRHKEEMQSDTAFIKFFNSLKKEKRELFS